MAITTMKIAANPVNKIRTRFPAVPVAFPRLKSTAKMMKPKRARANFHILISFSYSGACKLWSHISLWQRLQFQRYRSIR
jgi:hypothetical protein